MVRTGPDGALWVVDMYRYMIEHPEWLPQNGKDELRPFYRLGEDHGRIYRVVPKGITPRSVPAFDSTDDLIANLASPNGWQRDVAQNLLVRRRDLASVEPLRRIVRESENPYQRLHAICTLDGLSELTSETLQFALADKHSGVRRQAIELAARLPIDIAPLIPLVDDPDSKVRLQLATTLGHYDDPLAAKALAVIATRAASDPYIVAGVMSSLNERNIGQVLNAFLSEGDKDSDEIAPLRSTLYGQVAALGAVEIIQEAIENTCLPIREQYQPWQFDAIADLMDGLARRNLKLTELGLSSRSMIADVTSSARASQQRRWCQRDPNGSRCITSVIAGRRIIRRRFDSRCEVSLRENGYRFAGRRRRQAHRSLGACGGRSAARRVARLRTENAGACAGRVSESHSVEPPSV